ncbi:MAG: aminotransferase class I/II-fold pyridoxal phosphate-dependent enzyme [Oscillospiraceae bacterium]|nr:aminotransferase class I/II-fold pyridoxal phosphate-dependent enzyme [Oscillospiraceae bacterium]
MKKYCEMEKEELAQEKARLEARYQEFMKKGLKLDMSRGKPCPEQLDLSMDMLKIQDYKGETGIDARNYGVLEGMPEARRFFSQLLGIQPDEVIVGGNASLQMMYYLIELGYRNGYPDSERPWKECKKVKFLCPSPGYDRHFRITEYFGFELISVPMTPQGPDMDEVEKLVSQDAEVKGIWCVPMYSNPDGYTYSDETVKRFAALKPAAKDFKIFWDDAYCVHHLTDEPDRLLNLLEECKKCGSENMPFLFCSTSKVTFSGAGVAAIGASRTNVEYILQNMFPMTISFDKLNQLRHVKFLKDAQGVAEHMKKHRAILEPKFKTVLRILKEETADCGEIAHWTDPKGGYFISLYALPGTAKRIVALCKDAGVVLTGAGAAYPYGIDPQDSNIRIAPSFPPVDELEQATRLLCLSMKLATIEKLMEKF